MFRFLPALILVVSFRPALAVTAADVGDEIQRLSLDPAECYRVLDLNFNKEDLKVYLGSGYLVFTKPILTKPVSSTPTQGTHLGAVFVASAEGGDADVLLLPPTRSERSSLATFTNSPNLEEHFKSAVFVFTDGTGDDLLAQLQNNPVSKKSPEMGGLIAERWSSVLNNLISSFETRVVYDVLSAQRDTGMFYMAVSGKQLDNFDVLYDPSAHDQILVGKLGYRNNRTYFDTWTAFQSRSFRNGAPARGVSYALDNFRIEAAIQPDLTMQAVTRATLTLQQAQPRSALPFNLSPGMRITAVTVDGRPAEVFDHTSLRSNLIQGDDRQFLIVCDSALDPAVPHEIEIHHEGAVIGDAGNQVYFVGSRGTWYPRTGGGLANYDLTFRYPKNLTVAATGTPVDERIEGDSRITHVKTDAPVRFAGFNLGNFQSVVRKHNGYRIELYANHQVESALTPRAVPPGVPGREDSFRRRRRGRPSDALAEAVSDGAPDPAARMDELTKKLLETLDFMTDEFGPSSIRNIAVTPIPGGFGQGFPGLVYLSTLAYINPGQLPAPLRARYEQTFYSDILETHELAHQWWGNMVVPASYRDEWLIESLANYSALLLLERRKGVKAMDAVLDGYRTHLLTKTDSGRTLEAAGPIIWGSRLESSLAPDAWRAVTYEKGTWIIHMLRRRLGDEKFLALLREVSSHHHSIGTEEFRELASQYAPKSPDPGLKIFFDNWVYATGVPAVKLSYAWGDARLTGSLVQRDVDEAFTAYVPVEVQTGGRSDVYWLPTGSDPVAFSIPLKSPPARVALLGANCLMTTSK